MLMIPVMHRLAGELKPIVLHIAARTVGTHTMSIFGDHSDVMAVVTPAGLCSAAPAFRNVLTSLLSLTWLRLKAAYRSCTSSMVSGRLTKFKRIKMLPAEELGKLIDRKALYDFKHTGLNPEHPVMRSTVTNPDMFFQSREANNIWYQRLPYIVQDYMDQIGELTGRPYHLFDYYGAPDAEHVVVAMGSVTGGYPGND